MGEVRNEIHAASNWGYEPSFQMSHDSFIPNKSYKEMEYKMPIMNYLKQSLSLLDNCSTLKVNTKDEHDTQRRPLPLHKRKDLMLRDILSVEAKKGDDEGVLQDALTFKQMNTLDKQLSAIDTATKLSVVEHLNIIPDIDPIIIPSVSVVSSEGESDTDSVSIVAFDLKDANLEDPDVQDMKNVSFDRYIDVPQPTIKNSTFEFFIPTEQCMTKRSPTIVTRNVSPRRVLCNASPVIRGSLGRQRKAKSAEKVRVNLSTPPICNVANVALSRNRSSCYSRTFRTCEYFKHLEEKQRHLTKKHDKDFQLEDNVRVKKEETFHVDSKSCGELITSKNEKEECNPITLDETRTAKSSPDENFIRKTSSEDKTLKVNAIEFEGDAKSAYKARNNLRLPVGNNSDSFCAIHYMTGSENYERKLIPCQEKMSSVKQSRIAYSRMTTPTQKTNSNSSLQKMKERRWKSAQVDSRIRTNHINSSDSFWPSANRDLNSRKEDTPKEVNFLQKENKRISDLTKASRKNSTAKKRTQLCLKRPPVTMVSLKKVDRSGEESIKIPVNKNPIDLLNDKVPYKNDKSLPNEVNVCSSEYDKKAKADPIPKFKGSVDTKRQMSKQVISFPDDQLEQAGSKSKRNIGVKSSKKKRESVSSSVDRFKQNEYRDIQNKIKDENIIVSMDLIKKVLVEPREHLNDNVQIDYRLAPLSTT